MVKWLTTLLVIGLAVALTACEQKQADAGEAKEEVTESLAQSWGKRPKLEVRTEQSDLEATVLVEAPETGVDLGWGWNTFQAEPIPTVCVEFARDKFEAQTTTLEFTEINDSFELMKTLEISAEVSVKSVAYSAEGKAKFAKDVNVSGSSSTFVIEAEVDNGASYAAPTPPRARRGAPGASAAIEGEGAVRLTPEAARLARDDVELFKDVCGNGYVSATMGGAELVAVVKIETSSQSEKEKVEAEVSGSGWGVKVKAAMEGSTESGTKSSKREVSFYQSGGKDQTLPVDRPATDTEPAVTASEAILERVEKLAVQATEAEKLFQIAVTPYEVLENWPRGVELTGEEAEFNELAALWGAYKTLYDEIQEAMDDPEGLVVPVTECEDVGDGGGQAPDPPARPECAVRFKMLAGESFLRDQVQELLRHRLPPSWRSEWVPALSAKMAEARRSDVETLAALESLQDEVLAALDRLELDAEACVASEEACEFAGDLYRSPYSIRVRLPIPVCFLVETDALATRGHGWVVDGGSTRARAIKPSDVAQYLCHLRQAGIFSRSDELTALWLFVSGVVTGAKAEDLSELESAVLSANSLSDPLKLYADTQLREMARSRCRFGSLTPGCLSNAVIRQWAERIGMRSAVMRDDPSLAEAIECLSGVGVAALPGDPGADAGTAIWFAGDQPLEATLEKAGCKAA